MSYLINSYRFGTGLLLDTYPAAAAYSLRKLRTAYSGSAIRVRRASDNTEQDIGFSGNDLDTAALTSFCSGTNGFIRTWYDQSGNGRNLGAPDAFNQPRIVLAGTIDTKNTKPAIYFDSRKLELGTSMTFLAHSSNWSSFSVSSHETAGESGTVWSITDEARASVFHNRSNTPTSLFIQNTGGTGFTVGLSVTRDNSNLMLLSIFVTSSKDMSSFDNGATGTTNTYTGTYNNNNFRVGRQYIDLTPIKGHIPEIILYDSNQSGNRSAIETDINTYYGVF